MQQTWKLIGVTLLIAAVAAQAQSTWQPSPVTAWPALVETWLHTIGMVTNQAR